MDWVLQLTILFIGIAASVCDEELRLKVVTVATDETDGYKRFIRSTKVFGLDVEVFGLHEAWLGGDMANGPGGGHKINILRKSLKKYKDDKDLVLMFTDSYDVVFASGKTEILEKFKKTGAQILISAEDFCWPDKSLKDKYPVFGGDGYQFLCSGGIIGYAPAIYEMISLKAVNHTDDDQLYYTQIYLKDRLKYNIKLDRTANLFQNLHGNEDHVALQFEGSDVRVMNNRFKTLPVVIHGNGPSKLYLDHLANYVPKAWSFTDGCLSCKEDTFKLQDYAKEKWPKVLIGLFVTGPTPFVSSFLRHISNLDYPKDKIDVFLHNVQEQHIVDTEGWVKEFKDQYKSLKYEGPDTSALNEQQGRNMGMLHCKKVKCDYYFSVDASVTLSNRRTLQSLMELNRSFLTPMLSRPEKYWSNFWGAIDADGFYARSPDYLDIVTNQRRGIWNSPYVTESYLIKASIIDKIGVNPFTFNNDYDTDIQFTMNNRFKSIFMYVSNLEHYGHLKDPQTFNFNYKHNDLYQVFDNRLDWEDQYLHPNYTYYLDINTKPIQPCTDVYWVPMFTTNLTQQLIEECEHFGQWSGGKHKDSRVSGGYENVPTVDIHMNQIGFEKQWLHLLKIYFSPMVSRLFSGYNSHNQAIMNFVVKYTPTGQYFLRPHHDASTYTVNLALNKRGVDYEGGGARFIRYNCSVVDTEMGWALLHPGRLTHQHEGLATTKGTRYIMISFVDP